MERFLDLTRAITLFRILIRLTVALALQGLPGWARKDPPLPVRMRLALEGFGVTYLKLGQFLATRFDLLPLDVCRELGQLFDHVAPMSFEKVRDVIEQEFQQPLEQLFSAFDRQPVASASIAQVHRARTLQGHDVAVKVQRPGISRVFDADVRNLRRLSQMIDRLGLLGNLSAVDAIEVFASYTRREMDFVIEGQTADRLRSRTINGEIVPLIHWQGTKQRVLTMDFINGLSLAQVHRLKWKGNEDEIRAELPNLNIACALHNIAVAVLHQLFTSGFFHADPHPGNVIICKDNIIAFVDFGIFGSLTDSQRKTLSSYIQGLSQGNVTASFRQLMKLLTPSDSTDCVTFEREIKSILRRWYRAVSDPTLPIQERQSGKFSGEMIESIRRHRMRMGMDTLLFWRALTALDSTAAILSDNFDLLSELRRFFFETRRQEWFRGLTDHLTGSETLRTLRS
jgi:ubiquinone biosynthesis protein